MSVIDVLAITRQALEDDQTGLAAYMAAIAAAVDLRVRTNIEFGKWALPETMVPTSPHHVVVRPAGGLEEPREGRAQRDGVQAIVVAAEVFSADPDELQDTLTVLQVALLQVFDELRSYSDAHGGTVIEIDGDISTRYGVFPDRATSGGVELTINIRERSKL